ncbi:1-acylglycerophosphocholine O-acyltransferase 1, putative, partial [Bodo saltans]
MSRTAFEPAQASPTTASSPVQRGIGRLAFPAEVVNPFINNIKVHSTFLQKLKMVALGITIFPIRLTGFALFLVLAWGFAKLALIGYSDEELRAKPMKTGLCKRLVYACSRCCMFFLGYQWFKTETKDWALRPDGTRKEAPILVVNHSTVCDGFLLYYTHGLHSVGVDSVADA